MMHVCCLLQYIRSKPVGTMALRPTGKGCTQKKSRGTCRWVQGGTGVIRGFVDFGMPTGLVLHKRQKIAIILLMNYSRWQHR